MSPSPLLTCYCDASTEKRLILTSSAFVAEIETSKRSVSYPFYSSSIIYPGSCNNRGELRAIALSIEWLESLSDSFLYLHRVCIKSDSKEALDMILHPKQGLSIEVKKRYLLLKSRVESLSIVHVNRREVQAAHLLARKVLREEIDRLEGIDRDKIEAIRQEKERRDAKRIEKYWKVVEMLNV